MIQSFEKAAKAGFMREVKSSELEMCTSNGWVLLAIIQKEYVKTIQVPVPGVQGNFTTDKDVPCTQTRYLLRLDEESSLAELARQKDYSDTNSSKYRGELYIAKQCLGEAEKQLVKLKNHAENDKKRIEKLSELVSDALKAKHKLEEHIAAVREEIGDAKMREIVAKL